ncbi:hypothetical protein [Actinocorallia longicatena]|uniref:Uncharacterized protein n=1 Tax=Actinocorallia longicatena TaxID=111803 RepID=A0ABP6Q8E5_9ACTN
MQTLTWIIMGSTGSAPGVLSLSGGRVAFEAFGRGALTMSQLRTLEQRTGRPGLADHLTDGHRVPIFEAPLEAVTNVTFPWYYFGGGMKLTIGGHPFRFSFLQPQNTRFPGDLSTLGELTSGRAGGRAWKSVFA